MSKLPKQVTQVSKIIGYKHPRPKNTQPLEPSDLIAVLLYLSVLTRFPAGFDEKNNFDAGTRTRDLWVARRAA